MIRALAAAGGLALLLAACGSSGGTDEAGATPAKATTTTTVAVPVAPLTGVPDPSGVAKTRPVLTVKIENTPISRPQAGLEAADIVWEEVVEGGITRFAAMFQSTSPPTVGPIRSVRRTDQSIVWPVGGIFSFSGGAQYALDSIRTAPVNLVDETRAGDAMFRDSSRRAPDNLFGHTDQLFAFGGEPVPPPPVFDYRTPKDVAPGDAVTSFTVGFQGQPSYAASYTWDATSGTWVRSMSGRPFMAASRATIAPRNVVVEFVRYQYGGPGVPGAEGVLDGEGPAWVFTDGKVVKGTWSRPDKAHAAELRDAAGAPIKLTPGQTWVELPDTSYAVTIVSPAPAAPAARQP